MANETNMQAIDPNLAKANKWIAELREALSRVLNNIAEIKQIVETAMRESQNVNFCDIPIDQAIKMLKEGNNG